MICQRCGLCCLTMDVIIRVGDKAMLKPGGKACPHLSFEDTQSSCAVHAEPWYEGSPCHVYGNPDYDPDFAHKRGRPCPVGQMTQEGGGLVACRGGKPIPGASEDDLYDCGPWQPEYDPDTKLPILSVIDGGKD